MEVLGWKANHQTARSGYDQYGEFVGQGLSDGGGRESLAAI